MNEIVIKSLIRNDGAAYRRPIINTISVYILLQNLKPMDSTI